MKSGVMIATSLILVFTSHLNAQNLIRNSGFEEKRSCPQLLSDFEETVLRWYNPTNGTPNYYHACAAGSPVGVPDNFFGSKNAVEGQAYVGIMQTNLNREYIGTQLTQSLKAGKTYLLQFYSSVIFKGRTCHINAIDFLFSSDSVTDYAPRSYMTQKPTFTVPVKYSNDDWVPSKICYTARGGERFLTIGDFTPDKAHHACVSSDLSYFYIDDIQLHEEKSSHKEITVTLCPLEKSTILDGKSILGHVLTDQKTLWDWGAGPSTVSSKIINQPGKYALHVIHDDCREYRFSITVSPGICDGAIYLPNVFSPNGDGLNDVWEVGAGEWKVNQIAIYDRWGTLMYHTPSEGGWKGDDLLGRPMANGVYVYKVITTNKLINVSKTWTGSVTLVR